MKYLMINCLNDTSLTLNIPVQEIKLKICQSLCLIISKLPGSVYVYIHLFLSFRSKLFNFFDIICFQHNQILRNNKGNTSWGIISIQFSNLFQKMNLKLESSALEIWYELVFEWHLFNTEHFCSGIKIENMSKFICNYF